VVELGENSSLARFTREGESTGDAQQADAGDGLRPPMIGSTLCVPNSSEHSMNEIIETFDSRLKTLALLIDHASKHFQSNDFLTLRLADDMHPLGTQIAFTCNQPHNFAQWVCGEEVANLDPDVPTLEHAQDLVAETRSTLASDDLAAAPLPAGKRLDFGPRYIELSGNEYVRDFLIPNFYFHLVTAYDILRANGLKIGKADYMAHLSGRLKERADT
jgi:hypothetical protein